jgi:hypothetical protein
MPQRLIKLRARPSSTPKVRDRTEERQRSRGKETAALVAAHPSTAKYNFTVTKRGTPTPLYQELSRLPAFQLTPKAPGGSAESLATRRCRKAALARWHPATNTTVGPANPLAHLAPEVIALRPEAISMRHWRRGESGVNHGSYRQAPTLEVIEWVDKMIAKEIKWTDADALYKAGKMRVSPGTMRKYVYGKDAPAKLAALKEHGFAKMGARRQVLTEAQENFGMALLIEMALRRRPLNEKEWCRWAAATAFRNGTRTGVLPDMRGWYTYAKGRILREFGFNIEEVATQQLSKARAGVLASGVRAFTATITSFIDDHPRLAEQGLRAHGNFDESKLDLNKLLQRRALVPDGAEAQWEVEGERCPQITFLGGFMGYRNEERATEMGLLATLASARELIELVRGGDTAGLSEELIAKVSGIGSVAGYPKLPANFWDDEDFCLLPALLIFNAGDSAPDPAWSNFVHDKDRLILASTESGYVTTELKYAWYKHCKAQPLVPWGKRPTLPTADHHASNESVAMSLEMEADEAYLAGGPGHSTHLLQDLDQRGGPIQHEKGVLGDLVCHSYRIHGSLSRARIAQCVELAYVLSFTPAICAYATTRVGWDEDANGRLVYNPFACPHIVAKLVEDETVVTEVVQPVQPEQFESATTGAGRLALFRAGALDGLVGVSSAREAAREVLGKGAQPGDGWDNEEDMAGGVINEAGGRARRNRNEKGGIMSTQTYRDAQMAEGKTAEDKEAAARAAICKVWRIDAWVLSMNQLAEGKLLSGEKLTPDEMTGFIRARTNKAVPQAQKRVAQLTEKVEALHGKPVVVRSTMQPDYYDTWLAAECAKADDKAAAKAAAKQTAADSAALAIGGAVFNAILEPPAAAGTDDESEGDDDESDEGSDEVDGVVALPPPRDRVGDHMEIQGCDADECDYVCNDCAWEACVVVADDGLGNMDVQCVSDGSMCMGIKAHRFLRFPGKRARQR